MASKLPSRGVGSGSPSILWPIARYIRTSRKPRETKNLLRIALIHSLGVSCGITSIRQSGNEIHIYPQRLDLDRWSEVADAMPGQLRILMSGETHLCLRLQKTTNTLDALTTCLCTYLETSHAEDQNQK